MAKAKDAVIEAQDAVIEPQSGSKPTQEETIEILTTQVRDYSDKAEYFKTMAIKAQGALEVLSQIDLGDSKGE